MRVGVPLLAVAAFAASLVGCGDTESIAPDDNSIVLSGSASTGSGEAYAAGLDDVDAGAAAGIDGGAPSTDCFVP